jgi:hypothetical protein
VVYLQYIWGAELALFTLANSLKPKLETLTPFLRLSADPHPVPDPVPDPDSGFDDRKLKMFKINTGTYF